MPAPPAVKISVVSFSEWLSGTLVLSMEVLREPDLTVGLEMIRQVIERLTANTPDWHLEARLPSWSWVTSTPPRWAEAKASLGLTAKLCERGDVAERGALASELGEALSGEGIVCHTPILLDWAIAPVIAEIYRSYGQGHGQMPEREVRAQVFRSARAAFLAPYAEGRRLLRNRGAFLAFHAELSDLEAVLLVETIQRGSLNIDTPAYQSLRPVFETLAAGSWLRLETNTVGKSITIARPAINANRLLREEILRF